jgi:purine-nucleoside phosphorylase
MPGNIIQELQNTTAFIRKIYPFEPEAGIVLGSGLGHFADEMTIESEIAYSEIPHFPVSTVAGHEGKLLLGKMAGKTVLAMAGRFHYYEGYSPEQVVFPVRLMKFLGVKTLLISNAAGGMNASFRVGDLMIIRDHISLFTVNPLIGKNADELGSRFPDMSEPYDLALIKKARKIADGLGIAVHEGVYTGVTGPTFETRAEYRLLHLTGGDAVGMSTVQEVIAAVHCGLKVFALSVITDIGIREEPNVITHQEVLDAAAAAEPRLTAIFKRLLAEL